MCKNSATYIPLFSVKFILNIVYIMQDDDVWDYVYIHRIVSCFGFMECE